MLFVKFICSPQLDSNPQQFPHILHRDDGTAAPCLPYEADLLIKYIRNLVQCCDRETVCS